MTSNRLEHDLPDLLTLPAHLLHASVTPFKLITSLHCLLRFCASCCTPCVDAPHVAFLRCLLCCLLCCTSPLLWSWAGALQAEWQVQGMPNWHVQQCDSK